MPQLCYACVYEKEFGYKGVSRRKSNGKWRAKINKISLGTFSTEIEAAAAYDMAALSLFGEYALTNEEAFGKS